MRSVWHHLARLPLLAAGIHEIGGCSARALHAVMPGFLWNDFCQELNEGKINFQPMEIVTICKQNVIYLYNGKLFNH